MKWSECYSRDNMPDMEQISAFISSTLWDDFISHLQSDYKVSPKVEYSTCCGAPGWNVKYKKSGRALCTLYPNKGFFTCLVSVGAKEAVEAELMLPTFTETVNTLFQDVKPMNGARWLMIPVTSADIMRDVEQLVALRISKK